MDIEAVRFPVPRMAGWVNARQLEVIGAPPGSWRWHGLEPASARGKRMPSNRRRDRSTATSTGVI